MFQKLLKRKVKLETTQEAFDKQAENFLKSRGFEVNEETLALFGSFIQHSDENEDSFDPDLMERRIKKAFATRCAFYLIQPSKRPKKDEQKEIQPTEGEVVSKA